jgi:hypothetical protein
LNCRVSLAIVLHLDEGETARALGLTVERDAHALNGSSVLAEGFSNLLFGDRVRQIPDEQLGTHDVVSCAPFQVDNWSNFEPKFPFGHDPVTSATTISARPPGGKREHKDE